MKSKLAFCIVLSMVLSGSALAQCSFYLTGGGTYCTGTTPTTPIGISYANQGAMYTLYRNGVMVDIKYGANGFLSFGNLSTAGTYTASVQYNGCSANSNSVVISYVSGVGQVSNPYGTLSRCRGSGTTTYSASATSASSYTWSISPSTAGTMSGSGTTRTVTWNATFSGTATVTVRASGCNTTTQASTNVTVTPLVGQVSSPSGPTSRCVGSGTTSYTATASNITSYAWAISPSSAGTISSSGVVTWSSTFSGAATITVTATGCNSSSTTASTNVVVTPNVGQVSAPSGAASRCVGSGTSVYTASASNASSYGWSISPAGAGTINSSGTVTWSSTFTGTATVTVTASGCNGSTTTASTAVTIMPNVGAVTFTNPATIRCYGAGTTAFTATASNATGYAWALTPSSAGTINSSGVVTWSASFNGTATITVTASGCGTSTSGSVNVAVLGVLGQVSAPSGPTTRCAAGGTGSYTATAPNAQSYTWSISPTTAGTISTIGTVTWNGSYSGTATVTVVANGCLGATSTASTSVMISPAVGQVSTPSGPASACSLAGTGTYSATAPNATSYTWSLSPTSAGAITSAGVVTWSSSFTGSASVVVVANGCGGSTSTASYAVTINASPTLYNVTAPATVCSNTTVTVKLSASQSGVSYQLYKNNVATGSPKAGNGSALNWTGQRAGTYKILASRTGCTNAVMNGQPTVTQVGPTSAGIAGPTLVNQDPITLSASPTGFTYAWKRDGVTVGTNSASLSTPKPGSYTITVSGSGCTHTSTAHFVSKATKKYYNGIIASTRWRIDKAFGVTGSEFSGMYTYDYDNKYQVAGAEWKTPNFVTNTFNNAGNTYRLADMNYDANGNITMLKRFDVAGAIKNNFTYAYQANKNKLSSVSGYVTAYNYDQIGRMTSADKVGTEPDQYVDYDVSGKVTAVYSDAAKTTKVVEYLYDDRGFRLAKTAYSGGTSLTTWYVRDAAGSIVSIYEQVGTNEIYEKGIPIYGSGKLGTYESTPSKRNFGSVNYEITDHLGNVRALLRDNANVYVATMEDNGQADIRNPRVSEMAFFDNIPQTVQQDAFMNMSSPIPTVVDAPNKVAYLFWNDNTGTTASDKAVGPAIALKVSAGDKVQVETWTRYEKKTSYAKDLALTTLSSLLGTSFTRVPVGGGFEGQTPGSISSNVFNALSATGFDTHDNSTSTPFAYVNYILYNSSMVMVDAGWKRVPLAAGSDNASLYLPQNKPIKLSLDAPVDIVNDGFIYVWVSNQSKASRVWFDDLTVTHQQSMVVQATDYGVWGDVVREQKSDTKKYRFGYQGQFAEKDEETGWNHFDAREYDATVGRWNSPDPYGQFNSPYLAIHNSPPNSIDKDGRIAPWIAGAIVGGVVGGAFNLYTQMAIEGKGFGDISWGRVGAATGTGALAGTGLGGGFLGYSLTVGASMGGEVADQLIANGKIDKPGNIIVAGLGAAVVGPIVGKGAHFLFSKVGVLRVINGYVARKTPMVYQHVGNKSLSNGWDAINRNIATTHTAIFEGISGYASGAFSVVSQKWLEKNNRTFVKFFDSVEERVGYIIVEPIQDKGFID